MSSPTIEQESLPIEWLEKRALQLRKATARQLAESFSVSEAGTLSSHLELYAGILPLPSGRAALRFNDAVTSSVLKQHVLPETDPYTVAFLAAKVIEQSFYLFFDPTCPDVPIKNLSVAKHYGTFFTPPDIARSMACGVAGKSANQTLLDPAVGSGVLLSAPLLFCSGHQYRKLIGVELDPQLAAWCRLVINRVADLTGFGGEIEIHVGDGLEFLLSSIEVTGTGPDVIVNPPYGRLRLTTDRATNAETALNKTALLDSDVLHAARSSISNYAALIRSKGSIFDEENGILEYSRLFFRASAELVKTGSAVAIITPDSWMAGREGAALRSFLTKNKLIEKILLIREGAKKFSTVNQATAITFLNSSDRIKFLMSDLDKACEESHEIDYAFVLERAGSNFSIPRVSGEKLEIFKRLSKFPRIADLPWCHNARGEIDQSAQKSLFTGNETAIRLVRGEHLNRFAFQHTSTFEKPSYLLVEEFSAFIKGKPKKAHFERQRIAGRQCSYAQQKRRLVFCRVPNKHALGNSCNYIVIDGDSPEIELERTYLLLGLLNSSVLDWFFRVENSNNHVANYEIDSFPVPVDTKWFPLISWLAWKIESIETAAVGKSRALGRYTDLLEAVVGLTYGLEPTSELRLILEEINDCSVSDAVNFAVHLHRGTRLVPPRIGCHLFNHEAPTLSELDRLIISHVPEGGNWQNIPESVPSERLQQIRAMTAERGVVRTTYYGRLRRDQPSYTINTYFNRPGNGTHIHPTLDRTLTSREAARLQGFPDAYFFTGPGGAVRDQIGNAVPPPLAAAIGKEFIRHVDAPLCVDIFCGAGGLSLGLEAAGWEVICAIDNNRDALNTYCFNRQSDYEPNMALKGRTAVFQRDLHDRQSFEDACGRIEDMLNGATLGLLAGGPPCQGFSHGGYRLTDDKRNDLASIYLHFAERLRPKIFLLENVEGLATYKGGQVLRDIVSTIEDVGYRVSLPTWNLCAEEYGTPQMRRRVFVVATRVDGTELKPPAPQFRRCAGRRAVVRSAPVDSVGLAAPVNVGQAFAGLSLPEQSVPPEYARWIAFDL